MNVEILYAALSVLAVSLVSLAGLGVMSLDQRRFKAFLPFLISIAAGAMLGNALLHLLPESITEFAGHAAAGEEHAHGALPISALVLAGMCAFFGFDLWLHKLGHCCQHQVIKPVGWMLLVGDGMENLMDGFVIGAAYLVSIPTGIATTVAVLVHEIPIELGDFGVLTHAGFSRRRALLVNLASAAMAFVGCFAAITLGSTFESLVPLVAPFAAGAFIYMAASSLFPTIKAESVHEGVAKHFFCVLTGVAIMAALLLLH